jgi:DNA-binding MarR family transcriptional regulator
VKNVDKFVNFLPAAGEGQRGEAGHIAYLLRQANAATRQVLNEQLAGLGLTSPQFLILNLVDAYPGVSGAQIARIAQVTAQTLNLIVRKLEIDGLIERTTHESHGRVLCLGLTAKGESQLKLCKRQADIVENRLLALVPATHQKIVRRWLAQVAMEFYASK